MIATSDTGPEPSDTGEYDPGDSIEVVKLPDSGGEEINADFPTEYFIAGFSTGGSYAQPPAVPEPGTGALLGAGLIALAGYRRSVRRARMRMPRPER